MTVAKLLTLIVCLILYAKQTYALDESHIADAKTQFARSIRQTTNSSRSDLYRKAFSRILSASEACVSPEGSESDLKLTLFAFDQEKMTGQDGLPLLMRVEWTDRLFDQTLKSWIELTHLDDAIFDPGSSQINCLHFVDSQKPRIRTNVIGAFDYLEFQDLRLSETTFGYDLATLSHMLTTSKRNLVLVLDSGGGSVKTSSTIAALLEEKKKHSHVVTGVSGYCASACVDVYMAGTDRFITPSSKLKLHGQSLKGSVLPTHFSDDWIQKYIRAGVSEKWIRDHFGVFESTEFKPSGILNSDKAVEFGFSHLELDLQSLPEFLRKFR